MLFMCISQNFKKDGVLCQKEIWDKVLELAQERISHTSYHTFIKDTQLYSLKMTKPLF